MIYCCKTDNKQDVKVDEVSVEDLNKSSPHEKVGSNPENKNSETKNTFDINNIKTAKDSSSYLKHHFNKFKLKGDSINEITFFIMFPNDFKKFKSLYGYEDKGTNTKYGELYSNSDHIIDYDPVYVDFKKYINKLINISIGAHWQSDNVSHLQNRIINLFFSRTYIFLNILESKSDSDIESFWNFFFYGLSPLAKEELIEDVKRTLEDSDDMKMKLIIEKL